MATNTKYEGLDTPQQPREYAEGNLGKRNSEGLKMAFATSPILNGAYTAEKAREIYGTYSGENLQYGMKMYRRNFVPDPAAGPLYDRPRDKSTTPTGPRGLPGTPFSPNVASPGAGNGVDPTLVSNVAPGLGAEEKATVALETANPANSKTVDSEGQTNNVGKVRTFTLGIGSTAKSRF